MSGPTQEDIISALEEVNEYLLTGKEASATALLERLAPHVNSAGKDPHASYIAARKHLFSRMVELIDPRTGEILVP